MNSKIITLSVCALILAGCGPTVSQSKTGKLVPVNQPSKVSKVSKSTLKAIDKIASGTLEKDKIIDNVTTNNIKNKVLPVIKEVKKTISNKVDSTSKEVVDAYDSNASEFDSIVMIKASDGIEEVKDDEFLKLQNESNAIQVDIQ